MARVLSRFLNSHNGQRPGRMIRMMGKSAARYRLMVPLLVILAFVLRVLDAAQTPLRPPVPITSQHSANQSWTLSTTAVESYDGGLFTPLESLHKLSDSQFTTLRHPTFPSHQVRIKKTHFCDGAVNTYTGYIDNEARHLFFYFFESRNSPESDDVMLWTNGGPGCSSAIGLFQELGPCRILEDGPKYFEESWNTNANLLFIDQPIGVGFSYAEHGEKVSNTVDAAKDVAAFVAIFFEHFSQFKGRAFHMAGESYGGRYLPLFAAAVYDQNAHLIKAGMTPINISSVMIGDGMTDAFTMMLSYYDMACTESPISPILSIETCIAMRRVRQRAEKWMKMSCIDSFDYIDCLAATSFTTQMLMRPVYESGYNVYDISKFCNQEDDSCYPEAVFIRSFLDQPSVREQLGIDPSFNNNFTACNLKMNAEFLDGLDMWHTTSDYVSALLERDVRVLIYVGSYDWVCNWIGNERWMLEMEWSGKEGFNNQSLREWKVDGEFAGVTRSFGGLTFATVHGAGHYVPYDKPKQALEMVKRWLAAKDF